MDKPDFSELAGRRVLVTGSSSGIGAAAATAFGACGMHVVVHFHANADGAEAVAREITARGGRAIVLQRDLSARGAATSLVNEAAAALGGLDVLVNNAGDMLARKPLDAVGDDDIDRIIDVNIRHVVTATAAAIPHLRIATGGTIINVTSIAARSGGQTGGNLYAASKGFISTYTRGLARELAPDNIRVNAVSPGIIATSLHARRTTPEMFAKFPSLIPLGRVGEADECAGTFLFLASERLSGYLTGQTIEINGGQYMG
jgi:3-oxoacyl-[acyl-carrier protein] reductase